MRFLAFVAALVVCSAAYGAEYAVQAVEQGRLQLLRSTACEDPNTAITSAAITQATAGNWENMPTEANGLKIFQPRGEAWTTKVYVGVLACARSAADKTFTVNYWVWLADKGPALKVCSVAYTTGTQKVVKYPHSGTTVSDAYWADSGVITSGWPMTIAENSGGDNGVKMILFDTMGAYAIYAEVLNADGTTGAEAGDVTVYYFTMSG